MSALSTRTRVEAKADGPKLKRARFYGEKDGWIYCDIPDVITEFNPVGRQLLFLHVESGESYTFTLASVFVMEKNAARVIGRWLRFGDNDYCPPPPIDEKFNDVIAAFLAHARIVHGWDPKREFPLQRDQS